jgi:hypothetical protein
VTPSPVRWCAAALLTFALAGPARAEFIIGLTLDGNLLSFDSGTPGVTTPIPLGFLTDGDKLVGLDYRPANGQLYGVGQNGSSARLYTIDPGTGAATPAATLSRNTGSPLLLADFNPVADRLRILTLAGTNLRVDADTGLALTDGTLAYAPGDIHFGLTPAVTAGAYANSFAGATSTTLYGLDLQQDALSLIAAPNSGVLTTVGGFAGPGGFFNASYFAAFDISGATGTAYAALDTGAGNSTLYTVDLGTGVATAVGVVGSGVPQLVGLAAPLGPPPPPPGPGPVIPAPPAAVLGGLAALVLGLRRVV